MENPEEQLRYFAFIKQREGGDYANLDFSGAGGPDNAGILSYYGPNVEHFYKENRHRIVRVGNPEGYSSEFDLLDDIKRIDPLDIIEEIKRRDEFLRTQETRATNESEYYGQDSIANLDTGADAAENADIDPNAIQARENQRRSRDLRASALQAEEPYGDAERLKLLDDEAFKKTYEALQPTTLNDLTQRQQRAQELRRQHLGLGSVGETRSRTDINSLRIRSSLDDPTGTPLPQQVAQDQSTPLQVPNLTDISRSRPSGLTVEQQRQWVNQLRNIVDGREPRTLAPGVQSYDYTGGDIPSAIRQFAEGFGLRPDAMRLNFHRPGSTLGVPGLNQPGSSASITVHLGNDAVLGLGSANTSNPVNSILIKSGEAYSLLGYDNGLARSVGAITPGTSPPGLMSREGLLAVTLVQTTGNQSAIQATTGLRPGLAEQLRRFEETTTPVPLLELRERTALASAMFSAQLEAYKDMLERSGFYNRPEQHSGVIRLREDIQALSAKEASLAHDRSRTRAAALAALAKQKRRAAAFERLAQGRTRTAQTRFRGTIDVSTVEELTNTERVENLYTTDLEGKQIRENQRITETEFTSRKITRVQGGTLKERLRDFHIAQANDSFIGIEKGDRIYARVIDTLANRLSAPGSRSAVSRKLEQLRTRSPLSGVRIDPARAVGLSKAGVGRLRSGLVREQMLAEDLSLAAANYGQIHSDLISELAAKRAEVVQLENSLRERRSEVFDGISEKLGRIRRGGQADETLRRELEVFPELKELAVLQEQLADLQVQLHDEERRHRNSVWAERWRVGQRLSRALEVNRVMAQTGSLEAANRRLRETPLDRVRPVVQPPLETDRGMIGPILKADDYALSKAFQWNSTKDRITKKEVGLKSARDLGLELEKLSPNLPLLDLTGEQEVLRVGNQETYFQQTRRGGIVLATGAGSDIGLILQQLLTTAEAKREDLTGALKTILSIERVGESPRNPVTLTTEALRNAQTRQMFALVLHPSVLVPPYGSTEDLAARFDKLTVVPSNKTVVPDVTREVIDLRVNSRILALPAGQRRYEAFKGWLDSMLEYSEDADQYITNLIAKTNTNLKEGRSVEFTGSGVGGKKTAELVRQYVVERIGEKAGIATEPKRYDYDALAILRALVTPNPVSQTVVMNTKVEEGQENKPVHKVHSAHGIASIINQLREVERVIENPNTSQQDRGRALDLRRNLIKQLPAVLETLTNESLKGYRETYDFRAPKETFGPILNLLHAAVQTAQASSTGNTPSVYLTSDRKNVHPYSKYGFTKDIEVKNGRLYYHLGSFSTREAARALIDSVYEGNLQSTGLLRFIVDSPKTGVVDEYRVYATAGERLSRDSQEHHIQELLALKQRTELGIPEGKGVVIAGTGHRFERGRFDVLDQIAKGQSRGLSGPAFTDNIDAIKTEMLVKSIVQHIETVDRTNPVTKVISGGQRGYDYALMLAVAQINEQRRATEQRTGVQQRLISLEVHAPKRLIEQQLSGFEFTGNLTIVETESFLGAIARGEATSEIARKFGLQASDIERIIHGLDRELKTGGQREQLSSRLQSTLDNANTNFKKLADLRNITMVESADVVLAAFEEDYTGARSGTRHAVMHARTPLESMTPSGFVLHRQGLPVINIIDHANEVARSYNFGEPESDYASFRRQIENRISVVNSRGLSNQPEQGVARFYIGRSTTYEQTISNIGNLWTSRDSNLSWVTRVGTKEEAIQSFRTWFESTGKDIPEVQNTFGRMVDAASTGRIELACWCAPNPCHGHVLKKNIVDAIVGQPPANSQQPNSVSTPLKMSIMEPLLNRRIPESGIDLAQRLARLTNPTDLGNNPITQTLNLNVVQGRTAEQQSELETVEAALKSIDLQLRGSSDRQSVGLLEEIRRTEFEAYSSAYKAARETEGFEQLVDVREALSNKLNESRTRVRQVLDSRFGRASGNQTNQYIATLNRRGTARTVRIQSLQQRLDQARRAVDETRLRMETAATAAGKQASTELRQQLDQLTQQQGDLLNQKNKLPKVSSVTQAAAFASRLELATKLDALINKLVYEDQQHEYQNELKSLLTEYGATDLLESVNRTISERVRTFGTRDGGSTGGDMGSRSSRNVEDSLEAARLANNEDLALQDQREQGNIRHARRLRAATEFSSMGFVASRELRRRSFTTGTVEENRAAAQEFAETLRAEQGVTKVSAYKNAVAYWKGGPAFLPGQRVFGVPELLFDANLEDEDFDALLKQGLRAGIVQETRNTGGGVLVSWDDNPTQPEVVRSGNLQSRREYLDASLYPVTRDPAEQESLRETYRNIESSGFGRFRKPDRLHLIGDPKSMRVIDRGLVANRRMVTPVMRMDRNLNAEARIMLRRTAKAVAAEFADKGGSRLQIRTISIAADPTSTSQYVPHSGTLYLSVELAEKLNKLGSLRPGDLSDQDRVIQNIIKPMLELRHELLHATARANLGYQGKAIGGAAELVEEGAVEILNRSGLRGFLLKTFAGHAELVSAIQHPQLKIDVFEKLERSAVTGQTPSSIDRIVSESASKKLEGFIRQVRNRNLPNPVTSANQLLDLATRLVVDTQRSNITKVLARALGIQVADITKTTTGSDLPPPTPRTTAGQVNEDELSLDSMSQRIHREGELRDQQSQNRRNPQYRNAFTKELSREGYAEWLGAFLPRDADLFTSEHRRSEAIGYIKNLLADRDNLRIYAASLDKHGLRKQGYYDAILRNARNTSNPTYQDMQSIKALLQDYRSVFDRLSQEQRPSLQTKAGPGFLSYSINKSAEASTGDTYSSFRLTFNFDKGLVLTADKLENLLLDLERSGFKGRVSTLDNSAEAQSRVLLKYNNLVVNTNPGDDRSAAIAEEVLSRHLGVFETVPTVDGIGARSLVGQIPVERSEVPRRNSSYEEYLAEKTYETIRADITRSAAPQSAADLNPEDDQTGLRYGGRDDGELHIRSDSVRGEGAPPRLNLRRVQAAEGRPDSISFSSQQVAINFLKDISRDDPSARIEVQPDSTARPAGRASKSWFTYNTDADTLLFHKEVRGPAGTEVLTTTASEREVAKSFVTTTDRPTVQFTNTQAPEAPGSRSREFMQVVSPEGEVTTLTSKRALRKVYGDTTNAERARTGQDLADLVEPSISAQRTVTAGEFLENQGLRGPRRGDEFIIYEHRIPVAPVAGGVEDAVRKAREVSARGKNFRSYNTIDEDSEVRTGLNGELLNVTKGSRSIMPNLKFTDSKGNERAFSIREDEVIVPIALNVNNLPKDFDASDYVRFTGTYEGTSLHDTRISTRLNEEEENRTETPAGADIQIDSTRTGPPVSTLTQDEEEEQTGPVSVSDTEEASRTAPTTPSAEHRGTGSDIPTGAPDRPVAPRTSREAPDSAGRTTVVPPLPQVDPDAVTTRPSSYTSAETERLTPVRRLENVATTIDGLFGSGSHEGHSFGATALEMFGGLLLNKALGRQDDTRSTQQRVKDMLTDTVTDAMMAHPAAAMLASRMEKVTDSQRAAQDVMTLAFGAVGSKALGTLVRAGISDTLPNLKSAAGVLAGVTAWAVAPTLAAVFTKFKEQSQQSMAYDQSAQAQETLAAHDMVSRFTEEGEEAFTASVMDEEGNDITIDEDDTISSVDEVEDERGNPLPFDVRLDNNPFLPGGL